jgi:hypothetical protein
MGSMQNRVAMRQSDAEITHPHNDVPDSSETPAWHVHLELRPEELVVLHRMGFTGGALAWREGMREWQPLRLGDSGLSDRDSLGLSQFDDVSSHERAVHGIEQPVPRLAWESSASRKPTPFSHGRHNSPPLQQPLAVPLVRLRTHTEMLPPPPPVEPRTPYSELVEQSGSMPRGMFAEPNLSPPLITDLQELKPSSIPPGVTLEPRRAGRALGSKALWFGAAALIALSASNGALVSALLWSLKHDARHSGSSAAAKLTAAIHSAQSPAAACPIPSTKLAKEAGLAAAGPGSAAPALLDGTQPVSIDQLPLIDTTSVKSRETADSNSSSRGSKSRSATRRATAAAPARRSTVNTVSSTDEGEAAHRVDAAVAPAESQSSGAPDRHAMAQAVARASGAAAGCGESPQSGRVTLTFSASGNVQSVQLLQSFGEATVNSCVLRAMGRAHVHAFNGDAITVQKTLSW